MNANALRGQLAAKLKEAKELTAKYADGNMPTEDRDRVAVLMNEFDDIKSQLDMADRLSAADQFAATPQQPVSLKWQQSQPGEGDVPFDGKAFRTLEVKTPFGTKAVEYNVPIAVQSKGYAPAFDAYLRKGYQDLGPNDRKALSEGTDSAGGFLVPEDYQAELIKKIATMAVMRSICRVMNTGRDIVKIPRIKYTTDDLYTSGVRLTWTGEIPASATTHRVTDPVFGMLSIPVHTAMASLPVYNDLLEDNAVNLQGYIAGLMGEAFAVGEDNCFINGTGVAQPLGILTNVDVSGEGVTSIASGSTSSPYFTYAGLTNLYTGLPAQYEPNARFLASKATYGYIRQVVTATVGEPLWQVFAQDGGLGATPSQLFGFPRMVSDLMPSAVTASNYALLFGDFSGYLIVDRVGLSVQRLSEIYAETNTVLFLARRRVGGQVIAPWQFRVSKTA